LFAGWGKVAKRITKSAFEQGFISTDKVSKFETGQLAASTGQSNAALIFGGNAREVSIRAKKLLGWSSSRPSIFEEIPVAVASEAARLDMVKK
jgi:hypothetical protein